MVQQLSLFGAIDEGSYDLFVSTMITLSGNPPILYAKLSTVWIPNPSYQIEGVNSKNQLVEQTRIKLSKDLPLDVLKDLLPDGNDQYNHLLIKKLSDDTIPIDSSELDRLVHGNSKPKDNMNDDTMDIDSEEKTETKINEKSAWCVSISDIPAAGSNRKVSMQTINESILLSSVGPNATVEKVMNELGYIFQYEYITIGVKFNLKHNLVLELQKVWSVKKSLKQQVTKGGYLIKAFINVGKATDIDRMNFTETVLLNLQKELQGYVELVVPDRKSMDSRIGFD